MGFGSGGGGFTPSPNNVPGSTTTGTDKDTDVHVLYNRVNAYDWNRVVRERSLRALHWLSDKFGGIGDEEEARAKIADLKIKEFYRIKIGE